MKMRILMEIMAKEGSNKIMIRMIIRIIKGIRMITIIGIMVAIMIKTTIMTIRMMTITIMTITIMRMRIRMRIGMNKSNRM